MARLLEMVQMMSLEQYLFDKIDKTNLYFGVVSKSTIKAASLSHFIKYVVNFIIHISYQFWVFGVNPSENKFSDLNWGTVLDFIPLHVQACMLEWQ